MSASVPTLDDLSGDWLKPEREEDFSLPAIVNFAGEVQATWGPSGVQQWVCAPTGMATPTGLLFARSGERVRRVPTGNTEYRWRAYELERRTPWEGGSVSSRLRMPGGRAAVIERLGFSLPEERTVYLVFGGLARTWNFTDYWNLPPEDVPQMNARWDGQAVLLDDTKTFGGARIVPTRAPLSARVYASLEDLIAGLEDDAPGRAERGKLVALEYRVRNGDELAWIAEQGSDASLLKAAPDDLEALWESGRQHWEETWRAAFSAGNERFSGSLPAFACGDPALERLYYMSVLSLINSLRVWRPATHRDRYATGGQAIWAVDAQPLERAYVWGGVEGGTTTSFLWELQLQAPLLAMLDPVTLREQIEAFLRVDVHNHWGVETTTGRGAGMWYGVNDGAIFGAAHDYLRTSGDLGWLDKPVAGRPVREHLLQAAEHWRKLVPDGGYLADYGAAQNILECVSTYEHRIAAFNAMNAWMLRQAAEWLAPERSAELRADAESIAEAVRGLRGPDGYFDCLQPDGERRGVRTVLDFMYVGRFIGEDLTPEDKAAMLAFFKRELQTPSWLVALSPLDLDAITPALPSFQSYRADHQATGSYDGWPGYAASVLLRFGDASETVAWLRRISEVTHEGPFCQAHWVGTSEAERRERTPTRASFYNGNCALEACGCTFATTILEDACGLDYSMRAPGQARLRQTGVALPWRLSGAGGSELSAPGAR